MKTPEEILGERIRVARDARGMSQAELAEEIQSNQRVISQIEKGKTDMKMSTLRRIAAALRVSVDWLVKEQSVGVDLFGAQNQPGGGDTSKKVRRRRDPANVPAR